MSDQDVLTGLTSVTAGTQQWRLKRMHALNWGGFTDQTLDLDGATTLIAGMSGVGKSSLLDAWSAVLMPSRKTLFNAASNDAGSVRAAGVRSVLTYLRGKTGEKSTADGRGTEELLLRGGAGWCALALVFASTSGQTCTIGRLIFAGSDATKVGDVTETWFIASTDVHLRDFEPFARTTRPFHKSQLDAAFPAISFYGDYPKAAEVFITTLSLGHGGDGHKVLSLLHDIQRGAPIPSVDALFRERVLERPSTFARFDRGIAEFDGLVATHEQLRTMAAKREMLAPAADLHAAWRRALDVARTMDGLGDLEDPLSPFKLWGHSAGLRVLDGVVTDAQKRREGIREELREAQAAQLSAAAASEEAQNAWRSSGGDRLAALQARRTTLVNRCAEVEHARAQAGRSIHALGSLPATSQDWQQLWTLAEQILDGGEHATIRQERDAALLASGDLKRRERELADEVTEQGRRGASNIPGPLDRDRNLMAAAAGLSSSAVPFVGELIDMAAGQEGWRVAADAVLGAFARELLVDQDQRSAFSRGINTLTLDRRSRYTAVPTTSTPGTPLASTAPAGTLASKLVVLPESPFGPWLRERLDNHYAHECVESPEELLEDGRARVTRTGQELRGRSGAHGGNRMPLIGYTAGLRLAQLRVDLEKVRAELADAEASFDGAEARLSDSQRRQDAAKAVQRYRWADLDLDTAHYALAEVENDLRALEDDNPDLERLRQRADDALQSVHAAGANVVDRKRFLASIEGDIERLYTRRDKLSDRIRAAELAGTKVSAGQQESLDRLLGRELAAERGIEEGDGLGTARSDVRGVVDDRSLDEALRRVHAHLSNERRTASREADNSAAQLRSIFARYLDHWPDDELGTDPEDFPDYQAILSRLDDEGLDAARRQWADKTLEWTAQHALHMHNEFGQARRAIADGLEPLHEVLAKVPFGAGADRLQITAAYTPSPDVARFAAQLRDAASKLVYASPRDDTEAIDLAEGKFATFDHVLEQVRITTRDGRDNRRRREQLLDVRAHHIFRAQVVFANGTKGPSYDVFRDKSGGEAQELVAFISGAALRYQLGDDDRVRPRFAPVLIDEAFIKSDALTSHRGINAFKALGFQPIVVAPDSAVQALEPHLERLFVVTKNPAGHSSVQPVTKDQLTGSWDSLHDADNDAKSDGTGGVGEHNRNEHDEESAGADPQGEAVVA